MEPECPLSCSQKTDRHWPFPDPDVSEEHVASIFRAEE
jgi:hypothetical protein